MILSTSTFFEGFFQSAVTQELTFYLAAVVLVVLTAESCIKLLNRDSFGITVGVYVMVFRRSVYKPRAVSLSAFLLVRPKLWAGSIVLNRISRFHARCNTLDSASAEFWSF